MNYKRTVFQRPLASRRTQCKHSDVTAERSACERETIKECRDQCVSFCEKDGYPSLAAVYPPKQCWMYIDDGCEGFARGTIFAELDKPFMGDKCKNGGRCK